MQESEIFVGAYVIALGMVRKIKTIVKKDTGVEVSFEGKNPVIVSLDMLRPIPLSVEIMEKNGWRYNDLPFIDGWEQFGLAIRDGWIVCGQNVAADVSSVHRLQQFLTICDIEKKITLDGVYVDIPLEPLP